MKRYLDLWIAAVFALLAAVLILLPYGPRPEDLELTTTVRPLPPRETGQQQVEVTVRWHWLKEPGRPLWGTAHDSVSLVPDPYRWGVIITTTTSSAEDDLLAAFGEPISHIRFDVIPGEDGEQTMTIFSHGRAAFYQSPTFPLRVQYLHMVEGPIAPPGRSWIKATDASADLK